MRIGWETVGPLVVLFSFQTEMMGIFAYRMAAIDNLRLRQGREAFWAQGRSRRLDHCP
jgi:hypothetical protein